MKSLSNIDMSDVALLHVCDDVADERGLINAADVAERLRIKSNGKRTPAGTVSSRFSWMRRYGYLERVDPKSLGLKKSDGPRWVITREGAELMEDNMRAGLRRELDNLGPGVAVAVQRELAELAFQSNGSQRGRVLANAVRRQYTNVYANRRR